MFSIETVKYFLSIVATLGNKDSLIDAKHPKPVPTVSDQYLKTAVYTCRCRCTAAPSTGKENKSTFTIVPPAGRVLQLQFF